MPGHSRLQTTIAAAERSNYHGKKAAPKKKIQSSIHVYNATRLANAAAATGAWR
jgi:hypothetical protein